MRTWTASCPVDLTKDGESVYLSMPTAFRVRGFRFFFFSNETAEPMHIHIERGDQYAKFWLEPVQLAESSGFRSHEITALRNLVVEHKDILTERWHEHFGNKGRSARS